jgi:hypothetical protein
MDTLLQQVQQCANAKRVLFCSAIVYVAPVFTFGGHASSTSSKDEMRQHKTGFIGLGHGDCVE